MQSVATTKYPYTHNDAMLTCMHVSNKVKEGELTRSTNNPVLRCFSSLGNVRKPEIAHRYSIKLISVYVEAIQTECACPRVRLIIK
jgi:hypothetical protein